MKTNALILSAALAAISATTLADYPANFRVDWRGLPMVDGVIRDSSKVEWGFVNFIAFGPGWTYTAQDYAAKEHKKERVEDPELGAGLLFTGKIWAGGRGLAIREEFYDVSKEGHNRVRIRWKITSLDGNPMSLERAYLRFPVALYEFAGGTVSGKPIPMEYDSEWVDTGEAAAIDMLTSKGDKRLVLDVMKGKVSLRDCRKDKHQCFELRLYFPDSGTATESLVEFEVEGLFLSEKRNQGQGRVHLDIPPPPLKIAEGADWCVFPWTNAVKEGSILDFSDVVQRDAPAGKFGFAKVGPDGHFFFENDPEKKPRRFVGGNLCFDANFLSKEQAVQAVREFKALGWNTMRFHHIDVTITKDEWNGIWERRSYPEISPEKLDRLDFLAAECKKAGIYVTFDLYAMGCLGSCEGFSKPLNSGTIKAVVPIHKPAEDQWFRRAMEIFDHVNPYTGVKWKDEPSVLFVTLMNEDSIASVWWGAKELYIEKYKDWAALNGDPDAVNGDLSASRDFAEFLYEVKAKANRRMAKRLHDAGVGTFISGGNWWDNMAQVYEREALEAVDNHQYSDHPQESGYQKLPFHINNSADIKSGHPTYATPIMMAPTRVFGKPFTVTEWNFCLPNQWRSEAGLMMGAYASLQDWDGLYRFAWSHSKGNMFKPCPAKGFDIVTDPVGQLTERQVVLLFGRGDVSPARNAYAYGVTKKESMGNGLGDMWAKGLFPHPFTQLAYTSRIGSFSADNGVSKPVIGVTKVYSLGTRGNIPKFNGAGASDTGEISIDHRKGHLTVATARSAGVSAVDKADLVAGPLSVSGVTAYCSVSASSMDGADLADSKRILLFHVTDVLNTDMVFLSARRTDLSNWGKLPYLAKTGEAKIALRNSNPGLRVFALAPDGPRRREIPASYADGAYAFTVAGAPGEGANAPTMLYEIAPGAAGGR